MRRHVAAAVIQAVVRGIQIRKLYVSMLEWRASFARRHVASAVIQALVRGLLTRKLYPLHFDLTYFIKISVSAAMIQARARGMIQKSKFQQWRRSSCMFQKRIRGAQPQPVGENVQRDATQ